MRKKKCVACCKMKLHVTFLMRFQTTAVHIHQIFHRLLNILLFLPQTRVESCLPLYSKEPLLCIDLLSQLLCVSSRGLHCETFLSAAMAHGVALTEIQFSIKAI